MILPATTERVEKHTNDQINAKIERQTEQNIAYWRERNRPEIEKRIRELDREWDTERVLEANASTLIAASTLLGFSLSKKWFILGGIVSGFLLQHALQGWCPPLPVIRKMGVRTASEIHREKSALKQELHSRSISNV